MITDPPPSYDDRRTPMSPQLVRRVAILGTFALTMFAIIFFRLWFIQILSGQKYIAQAKVNRVRDIAIPAPRGVIMDRSGNLLVDSKRAIAVQVTPAELPVPLQATTDAEEARLVAHPPRRDVALYRRLARVLGTPRRGRACPINAAPQLRAALAAQGAQIAHGDTSVKLSPIGCAVAQGFVQVSYANVTLATDVPRSVLFYLEERQRQFPGVNV
jgi:penicillin-binding protein 2